ncbi:MAG TPA: hypothetical protein VJ718_09915 [Candidatus Binataceae bacterium]|nr:hypothetical protein [Candidatus Binataceae bacterium]
MTARAKPRVAIVVAIAMLVGGLPLAVDYAPQSRPALTLDICHPLGAVGTIAAQCSLPIPSATAIVAKPRPAGAIVQAASTMMSRPAETPDPPPPKTLA